MLHTTLIQLEDALTRLVSVSPLHAKEQGINLHLCPDKEEGDTVTTATSLPFCAPCLQQEALVLHKDLWISSPLFQRNTMTNQKS